MILECSLNVIALAVTRLCRRVKVPVDSFYFFFSRRVFSQPLNDKSKRRKCSALSHARTTMKVDSSIVYEAVLKNLNWRVIAVTRTKLLDVVSANG